MKSIGLFDQLIHGETLNDKPVFLLLLILYEQKLLTESSGNEGPSLSG